MPAVATTSGQSAGRSSMLDITRYAMLGGAILGCADIVFAWLFWRGKGATVADIFQSIARGIYGKQAAAMGMTSVTIGAACHFLIAICMVLVWLEFVSFKPAFNRKWVIWGAIYGILLYLFMNFVLLPMTPVGFPKFNNPEWIEASVFMHMVFGIWCAFCGSRYLAHRRR